MRLVLVLSLLTCVPAAAEVPESFAGLSLKEALGRLEARGLKLVYTSLVVRPEMRVTGEPAAREPRGILDELLRPHGLTARDGPAGVLMIVRGEAAPSPSPAEILGTVLDRRSGRPLAGVAVRLRGTDREELSREDGRFRLRGLAAGRHLVEISRPGYLTLEHEAELTPGEKREIAVELLAVPLTSERIDVTSSRLGVLGGELSSLALGRETLLDLPNVGGDSFRPLTFLPGTSGNDVSARFNVRGGRRDEVLVRLDGFEILEPYHLKELDSALGIVAPAVLESTELLTGGFSAEYGDRMGGVLEMTTLEPDWRRRSELDLSVVDVRASSSGMRRNERGRWLVSGRGGLIEVAARVADEEERPSFWDVFAKLDFELGSGRVRHHLRTNVLLANDRFDFLVGPDQDLSDDESLLGDAEDNLRQFVTSYENGYAWLRHQAVLDSERHVESRISLSRLDTGRRGFGEEDDELSLNDRRVFDIGGLSLRSHHFLRPAHTLQWGASVRTLRVDYNYLNTRDDDDPLAALRDEPRGTTTRFLSQIRGEQQSAYVSDRFERGRVTVEAGLRFDHNSGGADDQDLSPRLSAGYTLAPRSRLRGAWGLFHQSQRLNELQVEDGETRFFRAERSEHRILGLEHDFGNPGFSFRAELYERRIRDPRPRFENLFDPISFVPELENDRLRIAPEEGRSRGLELFLGGRLSAAVDGFLTYTWSRAEDEIAGRQVPRSVDQTHKVGFDLRARTSRGWTFNLAGEAHTGWPTTSLVVRPADDDDDDDDFELILGPLYGDRVADYYRLDLHISRRFKVRRGDLLLFLHVQNLTDARNIRGFEVTIETDEDEPPEVNSQEKYWGGILPNLGLRWTF